MKKCPTIVHGPYYLRLSINKYTMTCSTYNLRVRHQARAHADVSQSEKTPITGHYADADLSRK